jgi:receptor expression-enhancing protein 5/6
MTYERFAEAIVSLFVPFYDEFKSLAILFLILTRARVGIAILHCHLLT